MSFAEFEAAGWRLCGVRPGSKGPDYDGWNVAPMPAETIESLGYGAGLLHSLSGTCAFDIDDMEPARTWWAEQGVDVDALRSDPASVHIVSGRAGRDKLLYRLSKPLRTVKPRGFGFELRCATAEGHSVQDVLPPSIHPLTKKPYAWAYGDELLADWKNLPAIPANIYRVWKELAESEPITEVVNVPQPQPIDKVREAVKQYIGSRKLDMDNYNDWIQIGMRIHKQTGGDTAGLMVWDEMSKLSPKYRGVGDLRTHWLTFDEGGRIGLEAALREMPAAREEFDDETEEASLEVSVESAVAKTKSKLAEATEALEKRVVWVKVLERYFDKQDHTLFNTESGMRHTLTAMMPRSNAGRYDPVKILLNSTTKARADKLGFHPGEGPLFTHNGETYVNKYRNRLPEPLEPTTQECEIIEWLFDRIDDPAFREWLLKFYGHAIQFPGVKILSAPLIWSDIQGNGKSTLVQKIPSLLVGSDFSREVNSSVLESSFNDYLLDAWHVNLSEFRAGSRGEREAISKKIENWIADPVITIHPKGNKAFTIPNHFFVTASSNADDAASITNQDRKWAVHELNAPRMTEAEAAWAYDFLNGLRAANVLRHYFLNLNLAGFNPNARAPETQARADMAKASAAIDLECFTRAFEERDGPFRRDIMSTQEVADYIWQTVRYRPSLERLGRWMKRPPVNGVGVRIHKGNARRRYVIVYNHDRWKEASEAKIAAYVDDDAVSIDDNLLQ